MQTQNQHVCDTTVFSKTAVCIVNVRESFAIFSGITGVNFSPSVITVYFSLHLICVISSICFQIIFEWSLQTSDLDQVREEVVAHSSKQELTRKHSDDGEDVLRFTVCVWITAMP